MVFLHKCSCSFLDKVTGRLSKSEVVEVSYLQFQKAPHYVNEGVWMESKYLRSKR